MVVPRHKSIADSVNGMAKIVVMETVVVEEEVLLLVVQLVMQIDDVDSKDVDMYL